MIRAIFVTVKAPTLSVSGGTIGLSSEITSLDFPNCYRTGKERAGRWRNHWEEIFVRFHIRAGRIGKPTIASGNNYRDIFKMKKKNSPRQPAVSQALKRAANLANELHKKADALHVKADALHKKVHAVHTKADGVHKKAAALHQNEKKLLPSEKR